MMKDKETRKYIGKVWLTVMMLAGTSCMLTGCDVVPRIDSLPVVEGKVLQDGTAASKNECDTGEETAPAEDEMVIEISLQGREESVSASEDTSEEISEEVSEEVSENASEALEDTPVESTAISEEAGEQERPHSYEIADDYTAVLQIVETTENVNVRRGPGTEYEAVGLLYGGVRVQKISDGGEWSQILYKDGIYYVASRYIRLAEDGKELETTVTELQDPVYGAVSALPNDRISYGYGEANRDADNRPGGVLYYENLYENYPVDFLGPDTNTIYLTFNLGYEIGYTGQILDVLAQKNVKAVFFVTGGYAARNPELMWRMINEGHIIGNHSYAHPSDGMPSLGLEEQKESILRLHHYVEEQYGYEMKLFRYPSGIFSEQSLAFVNTLGYHTVFWSFAYRDWVVDDQPEQADALRICLEQLHPGAIYQFHTVSSTNACNMAAFIDGARAAGYEFGVYPENGF